MWLVDLLREYPARRRILDIGICRSEQKRSWAANTAGCPEKSHKTLLREEHSFRHSPAVRSVWGESDHCQPATDYRARDGEIIISGRPSLPKVALPSAARCFLFFLSNSLVRGAVRRPLRLDAFQLCARASHNALGRCSFPE
jgi:hypothetical protein